MSIKNNDPSLVLTPYQAAFYYAWLNDPARVDYNMVLDQILIGNLDVDRLNRSLIRFVNEYLLIRSNVNVSGESVCWVKRDEIPSDAQLVQFYPEGLSDDELLQRVMKPFDLERELLIRFNAIKYSDNEYRLVYCMPHILMDGLSYDSLLQELSSYYNDASYSNPISLEKQVMLHSSLSDRLDTILQTDKAQMHGFWEKRLNGISGADLRFLSNSEQFNLPAPINRLLKEVKFSFEGEDLTKIKQLSRSYRLTPYIYGQLVLGILLYRVTGQENIGIIFPVGILEGKDLIYGAHVNTIVIDFCIDDQTTIGDLVIRTLDFYDNLKRSKGKYLPVSDLLKYANTSVLDVAFVQANLRDMPLEYEGIREIIQPKGLFVDLTCKLLFEQELRGKQLNYCIRFDTAALDENLVQEFIIAYRKLFYDILESLSNNQIEQKIVDYNIVSVNQFDQQIIDWNQTTRDYPEDKTLQAVFEQCVKDHGSDTAIIFEGESLSYTELNRRANQLGHYLQSHYDIQGDDLVVLCFDRSLDMLIGILGVLKAGGAYVPADPDYPSERIRYMVRDTGAKVMLSNEIYQERLQELDLVPVIGIDAAVFESELAGYSSSDVSSATGPSNLAYVIYTSGTTGQPKGVMVEHRGLVSLATDLQDRYRFGEKEVLVQFANYVFDASVEQIFPALLNGHTLLLIRKDSWHDENAFLQNLSENNASYIEATPSFLSQYPLEQVGSLTKINAGGEALTLSLLNRLKDKVTFINSYGPTETTVTSIVNVGARNIYIGRPVANTTVYILDKRQSLLPIGAIGELYIGGIGVSRGYLNLPELTAERFIANPFQSAEERLLNRNGRLYRTGDLVRYLSDGNLEYLGRNDFQVKIRGYRIELGEIEQRLSLYPGISQSVVLALENKENKYLAGYYVSDVAVERNLLVSFLQESLPDYMVPSVFVQLEHLPLTINGKLDRKGLPVPGFSGGKDYHGPETELQESLCLIWSEVLGIPAAEIGIHDDFFGLGGNSITAIKLISRINHQLNTGLRIAELFSQKTIAALSVFVSGSEQQEVEIHALKVERESDQLLSYAQERLWFIEQYEEGSNAYNIPIVLGLSSDVDTSVLSKALLSVVSRHEILRSQLKTAADGHSYQQVIDPAVLPLAIHDGIYTDQVALDAALQGAVEQVFDLENGYPVSIGFYRYGTDRYLGIVVHHIAFDGWSSDVFIRDVLYYYRLYCGSDTQVALPALSVQYKEYALWQRSYLSGSVLDNQVNYWLSRLSGYETLFLPVDHVRPLQQQYWGGDVSFTLDEQTSADLGALASSLGVSMYSLLLSGYYLLLQGYSGQEDLVVGTAVSNRHHRQTQDLIGFFVNTLALRCEVDREMSVEGFIAGVGRMVEEAQGYQDLPFERLVESLKVAQDTSRHPVFQVMFSMESFGLEESSGLSELFFAYRGTVEYSIAKFDLSLGVSDQGGLISGNFNYSRSLFEENTIASYARTYKELLIQLSGLSLGGGERIRDLVYVDAEDYVKQIHDWNDTGHDYPEGQTLQSIFEQCVKDYGGHTAVIFGDTELSYTELNRRANQLGHYLQSHYDLQGDELVVLCFDRSVEMLIGILGVLKAGGAYVPADPSYPSERIRHMVRDTGAKVVLSNEIYQERLQELDLVPVIGIDSEVFASELEGYSSSDVSSATGPSNLAYVIYTSGTTGQPKGVMVEHRGLVSLATDLQDRYGFGEKEVLVQFANYVFDASVEQIFLALLNGHTLLLIRKDSWHDENTFLQTLIKHNASYIEVTPSFLSQYPLEQVDSLTKINAGGEALSLSLLNRLKDKVTFINSYGPTETTVTSIVNVGARNIYIGRPVANTTAYILDKRQGPLPIGAIGELYIGGMGVSRGYLNLPELTAERFIANPFQSAEERLLNRNGRLYRTGDLVRYLSDGSLEYLGRNDFQVKIRGYRIELGEIEQRLSLYPGISQSVVMALDQDTGNKYLAGYYVSDVAVERNLLVSFLQESLSDYMVPSVFVQLEHLPLTINGKLDRKGLPVPGFSGGKDYDAPETELQESLCVIWSEVLGIPAAEIGIHDDFFRLGGDSIVSIRLSGRMRQRLGLQVSVKDIFIYKTISQLSSYLSLDAVEVIIDSEQGELSGELGLLPVQSYFFSQLDSGILAGYQHWNQSFLVVVPVLDEVVLEHSVRLLLGYHDQLRAGYRKEGNVYQQYYRPLWDFEVDRFDVRGLSASAVEERFTSWQNDFDIFGGRLLRIGYVKGYGDGSARLYFAAHHLLIDTVSWRILTADLDQLYGRVLADRGREFSLKDATAVLGNKGTSYRQWVSSLSEYSLQANAAAECAYWTGLQSGIVSGNLSLSRFRTADVNHVSFSLDESHTELLLRSSNDKYRTQINDILLSALGMGLHGLTGDRQHGILLEGHGREAWNERHDLSGTVGWFTSLYPFLLEVDPSSAEKSVVQVKEALRGVPGRGIGYGVLLGYRAGLLPIVGFNYLGQFDQNQQSGGLWSICAEHSGTSVSSDNGSNLLVDINGGIIGGMLQFSFSGYLSGASLDLLSRGFHEALVSLIDKLSHAGRSYLSPSDTGGIVSGPVLERLQCAVEVDGVYLANSLQEGFIYQSLHHGGMMMLILFSSYGTTIMRWMQNCFVRPGCMPSIVTAAFVSVLTGRKNWSR